MANDRTARDAWITRVLGLDATGVAPGVVAAALRGSPLKRDDPSSGDRRAEATKVDAAASVNAEGLKRELAELIARIPLVAGDDAARRAEWMALATVANDSMKSNDLAVASEAVKRLREAMEADGGASAWSQQARAAWTAACGKADAAARSLQSSLRRDAPAEVEGLRNILISHSQQFDEALRSVEGGTDEAAQITGLMSALRAEMSHDPVFNYLDSNGVSVRHSVSPGPAFLGAECSHV